MAGLTRVDETTEDEDVDDFDFNSLSPPPRSNEPAMSVCTKVSVIFTVCCQCLALTFTIPILPAIFSFESEEDLLNFIEMVRNESNHLGEKVFKEGLHELVFVVGLITVAHPVFYISSMFVLAPLTRRFGYSSVALLGSFGVLVALGLMALFPGHFLVFLGARAIQGAGSSFALGSIMARIRTTLSTPQMMDDKILAWVTVANGLGIGFGPLLGGGLYVFMPFRYIFLTVACMIAVEMVLQIVVFHPPPVRIQIIDYIQMQALSLLMDPYALVGLGTSIIIMSVMTGILTFLPIWVYITQRSVEPLVIGLIVFPTAFSYVFGNFLSTVLLMRLQSWIISIAGLVLMALSIILLSFAKSVAIYTLGMVIIGMGQGTCIASIVPLLSRIVDRRHSGEEIYLFTLTELMEQLGAVFGPLVGMLLFQVIEFSWFVRILALILFAWSLTQVALRDPPRFGEKQSLMSQ